MKRLLALLMLALAFARPAPVLAQSYAAWLPYWEAEDAMEELAALDGQIDTAIAFAAIFDSRDRVMMLPETEQLLEQMRACCTQTQVTLSVVNDIELEPGRYDNKSSDLLRRILRDEESMLRHIEQLFGLVDKYDLAGLEIDYEALKDDQKLWDRFAVFIEELYRQFSSQGLSLRVVLSWDAPKYITLPEGPEYSVMCYNLYGYHSGSGPKADYDFLRTVAELYAPYAPGTRMALATGGFVWGDGIRALTQRQAQQLIREQNVQMVRDMRSGALSGSYAQGARTHTLWMADAMTLSLWRDLFAGDGFAGFDLFRLGGNDLEDLTEHFFE